MVDSDIQVTPPKYLYSMRSNWPYRVTCCRVIIGSPFYLFILPTWHLRLMRVHHGQSLSPIVLFTACNTATHTFVGRRLLCKGVRFVLLARTLEMWQMWVNLTNKWTIYYWNVSMICLNNYDLCVCVCIYIEREWERFLVAFHRTIYYEFHNKQL